MDDEPDSIPRKFFYVSSASEDQTNITGGACVIIHDQQKPTSVEERPLPIFSIGIIYKNLFILSLSFVVLFTAYNGIATLQSSLNIKNNVGVHSLLITYAFLIVSNIKNEPEERLSVSVEQFSSIFLISVVISIFGIKWCIVLTSVGYIFYIAANIYPIPPLMYISKH